MKIFDMKALILAAGKATRLSKHLKNYQKCMLRVGDKPVVEYSLDNAVQACVEEIIVVIGSRYDEIVGLYGDCYRNIPIQFVVQHKRNGLVHAIECAKSAINGDDFMLFLADELLSETRHVEMIEEFYRDELFALCGVVKQPHVLEIRKTYSILHHPGDRKIYRLIEKPRVPVNQLQGTGNLVLRGEILKYLEITPINSLRGERDLTDLIQCAIDDGRNVKWFEIGSDYVNINEPDDIRKTERLFRTCVHWPNAIQTADQIDKGFHWPSGRPD